VGLIFYSFPVPFSLREKITLNFSFEIKLVGLLVCWLDCSSRRKPICDSGVSQQTFSSAVVWLTEFSSDTWICAGQIPTVVNCTPRDCKSLISTTSSQASQRAVSDLCCHQPAEDRLWFRKKHWDHRCVLLHLCVPHEHDDSCFFVLFLILLSVAL